MRVGAARASLGTAEIARYLRQVLPASLDPGAAYVLEQGAERWIAGLHLATLPLRAEGAALGIERSIAEADVAATNYLMDEVLAGQPPAVQSFLLVTALLDRFCAPRCQAVVVEVDPAWPAQASPNWLKRGDLFLVPRGGPSRMR